MPILGRLLCRLSWKASQVTLLCVRGRQNEDTSWRQYCWRDHVSQMLTRFSSRATFVSDKNSVAWTRKMFWRSSEIFLVFARRATISPRFATYGNIVRHNFAATMCPRFPLAFCGSIDRVRQDVTRYGYDVISNRRDVCNDVTNVLQHSPLIFLTKFVRLSGAVQTPTDPPVLTRRLSAYSQWATWTMALPWLPDARLPGH